MAVLKGKAHWAKVDRAVNPFDPSKPRWSIDVQLVDPDSVKMIEEMGVPIKNKDDERGDFVTLQKDQFLTNGQELPKPRVIDSKKNDISGTLIGNGSMVKVSFYPKEWKYANRAGVRAVLKDVQVLELVEYIPKDEFDEEDGYVASDVVASDQTKTNSSASSDLEFD